MLIPETFIVTINQSHHPRTKSCLNQLSNTQKSENKYSCPPDTNDKKQENNLTKESITQKEILSHQTVRDIVLKSNSKVIHHTINKISPHSRLYRSVRETNNKANCQTAIKKNQKFNQIYKEFRDEIPAWKRIQLAHRAKDKDNRSQSRSNNKQSIEKLKNISISGLTTYNFHSVKARYRIAFDPKGTEEEVEREISTSKKRAHCSINRNQKIHYKTSPSQAPIHQSLSQIITHNYTQLSTKQYLQAYRIQKENTSLIYGEQLKNISNASKLIASESINQETAEFSINQIKLSCKNTQKNLTNTKKRQKDRVNTQEIFERRRHPVRKTKILVSNFQIE